jgi:Na+/H+ antiporter NhaD/arsenite permease-like protein
VAKLFSGHLHLHDSGHFHPACGHGRGLRGVISMVKTSEGLDNHTMYFWLTGLLSAFWTTPRPTSCFFNTAGGDAAAADEPRSEPCWPSLRARCSSGACTYIGNAPNFMVRSIAETGGIKMPSFFGYMAWSVGILVPCFVLMNYSLFPLNRKQRGGSAAVEIRL